MSNRCARVPYKGPDDIPIGINIQGLNITKCYASEYTSAIQGYIWYDATTQRIFNRFDTYIIEEKGEGFQIVWATGSRPYKTQEVVCGRLETIHNQNDGPRRRR
jgi:hypothetical protein